MKIKDIRKEFYGRFRDMEIYVLTKNIPTFAEGYREKIEFEPEDIPALDELNSEFYLDVDSGGYNSTVMVGTGTTIEKIIPALSSESALRNMKNSRHQKNNLNTNCSIILLCCSFFAEKYQRMKFCFKQR